MVSQSQFINKILSTGDFSIVTLNNLTSKYFFSYEPQFNFIRNHFERYGKVPDKVTFSSVFPDFVFTDVAEPFSYILEQVYTDFNQAYMAEQFNKMKKLLLEGKTDEAMKVYQNGQDGLKTGSVMTCHDLLKDYSDRYEAYIDRNEHMDDYFVTTGFKELDQVVGGFDRKEEFALIVARTNTGKSFVAIKMAAASAKAGLNVGYYSGEMSSNKVGYRMDTVLGNISNGALVHGNGSVNMEYERYLKTLSTIKGSFKVITPNDINGPADVNALKAFIQREHLDILFVDQISLLEDMRGGRTTPEKTANISKDLKNLQVMTGIPLVVVSQQNRTKTEDGVQDTTQIAMSDRLGQDCTMAIFLDKPKDNVMRLSLVKSRDTQNGNVLDYSVDMNKGVWEFIPSDKDGVSTEEDYEELENSYDGDDIFSSVSGFDSAGGSSFLN